jgi:hypothetical protein
MKALPAAVSEMSFEELLAEMDDQPLGAPIATLTAAGVSTATAATGILQDTVLEAAITSRVDAAVGFNNNQSRALPPAMTAVPPPDRRPAAGPLLFPTLLRRCPHCGESKHIGESICPHCRMADWPLVAVAIGIAVVALVLAIMGLSYHRPGILSFVGDLASTAALIAVPIAAALLVNAARGYQPLHARALPGLRWPAAKESCPRCAAVNVMPLFCCRQCGRLSWVRLAAVCAFATTAAIVVAVSQPTRDSPGWWKVLADLLNLAGIFVGALAAFAVFIGTLEVWQLQPRLPKEGRVYTSTRDQVALLGATLVPILCTALLVFGLLSL